MHPHLPRDMSGDYVAVVQLDADIALGRVSVTLPSTSITSAFATERFLLAGKIT